ncbi:hypothetical protein ANCCAN_05881 [Ancylostoma caninum]|uniref:Uncharacterized protein n=1 Tax=Ancylostoma caninum TaxID=29170 RepID=A0A368GYG9_ANCCA|nr:hypothetical protein ANCCAN_05881 [Ancylostoma caninum]
MSSKEHRNYTWERSWSPALRLAGTLLSFFGIKSFICKCHLPEQFCAVGHAQNAFIFATGPYNALDTCSTDNEFCMH